MWIFRPYFLEYNLPQYRHKCPFFGLPGPALLALPVGIESSLVRFFSAAISDSCWVCMAISLSMLVIEPRSWFNEGVPK